MNFYELIVIVGYMATYSFPSEPHFLKTKTCMACRNGGRGMYQIATTSPFSLQAIR